MISIFNEQPAPITAGVPVDNSIWSAVAVLKAARAVSDAIEKAAEKRARINNEVMNRDVEQFAKPVSPTARALSKGLTSHHASTGRIIDYVHTHPTEVGTAVEATTAIHKQLENLIDATSESVEDNKRLQGAVEEMSQAERWLDSRFPNSESNHPVAVSNSFRKVVDNFDALLK